MSGIVQSRTDGTPFSKSFPNGEVVAAQPCNMYIGFEALDTIVYAKEAPISSFYDEVRIP